MFVDAKVCSLDKLVQLAHETGLTRFKDWSDRLQTRSNHFFLQKNTKSAMVVQNRNAAEITVWGKKFPTEKHKVGYRGLAFHIQLYFDDGLCYQNAEEVYDSWI